MPNETYTINETYTLPSKGLVYDTPINPTIRLRSMTTEEEMRRLSHSETPYKVMSDIIEDCIVGEKPAIHVYDMCIGDYQFLLHRLRVVTYGADYTMDITCPNCGEYTTHTINLDNLKVIEYDESYSDAKELLLPVSGKRITLKLQTPRILDDITLKTKELKRKAINSSDEFGLLVTLEALIDKVDGVKLNSLQLEQFVRKMPMKDANLLLQKGAKLNSKVGLDNKVSAVCKHCGYEVVTAFRLTSEFFGPTVD